MIRTTEKARECSDLESQSRAQLITCFTTAATLAWVTWIWIWRFLPSTDYPMWIHQGEVFSQMLRHQAASCFSFVHLPVPNSLFVLTTGLLDLVFQPETSGKLFLSLYSFFFVLASTRLLGAMTDRRDSPLFLLPFLFVFNRYIWIGEINYSFSMTLLFFAIAYALKVGGPFRSRHLWAIAVFSMLLFFAHAVAYMCWIVSLLVLVTLDSLRVPRFKTFVAMCPSLALMALYVAYRAAPRAARSFSVSLVIEQLRGSTRFLSLFSPLHFVDPFYLSDPHWLIWLASVFNLSIIAVVLVLGGLWLRSVCAIGKRKGTLRAAVAIPAVLFAMFLFVPLDSLTGVPDVNYRLLLPALFVLLTGLLASPRERLSGRVQWALCGVTAAAVTIVLAFQFIYVSKIAQRINVIHEALIQAHLPSDFRDIVYNQFEVNAPRPTLYSGFRLIPVQETLRYLSDYVRSEYGLPGRVFSSSIIHCSVAYTPLLSSQGTLTAQPSAIVILGLQVSNHKTAALILNQYETMADQPYVMILRRKITIAGDRQPSLCLGQD